MTTHGRCAQVVQELLPKPDLTHSTQKLEKLLHQVYRAFPQKHWGNSRDAFCFRRVQIPIETFKRKCLERGQQLCQAEQWCSLLEYAQLAWSFVRKLPDWEDSSHNRAKLLCFRSLAAHCSTALRKTAPAGLLDQRQAQALVARSVGRSLLRATLGGDGLGRFLRPSCLALGSGRNGVRLSYRVNKESHMLPSELVQNPP